MYCNKCGTQMEAASNFCAKCGNTISKTAAKKESRLLPVVIASAAFLVAIAAVFLAIRNPASEAYLPAAGTSHIAPLAEEPSAPTPDTRPAPNFSELRLNMISELRNWDSPFWSVQIYYDNYFAFIADYAGADGLHTEFAAIVPFVNGGDGQFHRMEKIPIYSSTFMYWSPILVQPDKQTFFVDFGDDHLGRSGSENHITFALENGSFVRTYSWRSWWWMGWDIVDGEEVSLGGSGEDFTYRDREITREEYARHFNELSQADSASAVTFSSADDAIERLLDPTPAVIRPAKPHAAAGASSH